MGKVEVSSADSFFRKDGLVLDGGRCSYFEDLASITDTTSNRRRSDHQGAHENGSADWTPLPTFEIAIARTGAELVADQLVRVHGQAHGTACAAPFKTRFSKDLVEPFFFTEDGHDLRAWYGDGLDVVCHMMALKVFGDLAEIRQTAIGTGTEKGHVDGSPL